MQPAIFVAVTPRLAATGLAFAFVALQIQVARAQDEDPLAALAALGDAISDDGPEGGGSIRAKKDVDTAMTDRLGDPHNLQVKITEVLHGKFPAVAVKAKVLKLPKTRGAVEISKNETLVLVPLLKVRGGRVDMQDEGTRINAGSFYLRCGDKAMVRLGERRGKVWQAAYIERK